MSNDFVWVFNADSAAFPAAVFAERATAETWIRDHNLSGTLSRYPVDRSVYDWAVDEGLVRDDPEKRARRVGTFTSAHQEHYHYTAGVAKTT